MLMDEVGFRWRMRKAIRQDVYKRSVLVQCPGVQGEEGTFGWYFL